MVSLSIRGRNIKFDNDDGYMTPKHVWEDITAHIPKDKIIYEPFFGDGASGRYLNELGCMTVIHEKIDFFSHQFKYDLIISNPPYIPRNDINNLQPEVKNYDPMLALDGGIDGLDPYRYLAKQIILLLKPRAYAILEFGIGQSDSIKEIFVKHGYIIENILLDLAGLERAIIVKANI